MPRFAKLAVTLLGLFLVLLGFGCSGVYLLSPLGHRGRDLMQLTLVKPPAQDHGVKEAAK